jgi:hypothetical protein
MTTNQAIDEAVRRWGQNALVREAGGRFEVASGLGDCGWGQGESWEAAFADADQRAATIRRWVA